MPSCTSLSSCVQYFFPVSLHIITQNLISELTCFVFFVYMDYLCCYRYLVNFSSQQHLYWEKWWHVQYLFYPLYIFGTMIFKSPPDVSAVQLRFLCLLSSGFLPRLIKVAPACAIMISTYEFGKAFFHSYNQKKHRVPQLQPSTWSHTPNHWFTRTLDHRPVNEPDYSTNHAITLAVCLKERLVYRVLVEYLLSLGNI